MFRIAALELLSGDFTDNIKPRKVKYCAAVSFGLFAMTKACTSITHLNFQLQAAMPVSSPIHPGISARPYLLR